MAHGSLSPTDFASAVTALTSAFGDPTRRSIWLFAHEQDQGVTASEVAERFALHPNVARHHLDKLAGGGYLEIATGRAQAGGAGRPSKRYAVATEQIEVEVPVRHDDVMITLLGRALALIPPDQAEAMAEEVGVQYGRTMAVSMGAVSMGAASTGQATEDTGDGQRSFRASLHMVADALTAHGFAAHAEKRGDELRIVSEHCPFGGAAVEHPVICAVDRGMVKGMLAGLYGDTDPTTEASRPMGDAVCVTAVEGLTDRHYLDHASTSPPRPEVVEAMVGCLRAPVGDPGRIHTEGMTARVAVEQARDGVAALLGARSREVVFTSGGTEAIAAAVWGAAQRGRHQVVPAVEHSAVRESAARAGDVTLVGVDARGRVDPDEVGAAIRPDTAVIHVQWGNHEVGTTQPVAEVVALGHERGVLVHIDAAQAAGRIPIDFRDLGVDLVSISAHKFGGPVGVGALLVRRGLRLPPLLLGGDQERARRAGLENVPAIVGFGVAADALAGEGRLADEAVDQRRLTDRVVGAVAGLAGVVVYGDPDERLPHLVCLGILGIEPQAVLLGLDRAGIAAHSGSACSSEALEPSPVLEAMGVDAHRSLRASVGWNTVDADVDALLDALPKVIADLRRLGPA